LITILRLMCGHRGCQAASVDGMADGQLMLSFRGRLDGRWNDDPISLRLEDDASWPTQFHCAHCRWDLRLDRALVVSGMAEAKANKKAVRLVLPAKRPQQG